MNRRGTSKHGGPRIYVRVKIEGEFYFLWGCQFRYICVEYPAIFVGFLGFCCVSGYIVLIARVCHEWKWRIEYLDHTNVLAMIWTLQRMRRSEVSANLWCICWLSNLVLVRSTFCWSYRFLIRMKSGKWYIPLKFSVLFGQRSVRLFVTSSKDLSFVDSASFASSCFMEKLNILPR